MQMQIPFEATGGGTVAESDEVIYNILLLQLFLKKKHATNIPRGPMNMSTTILSWL